MSLDEIRARTEAASPGPWEVADDPVSAGDWMVRQVDYEPDTPDDVAAAIFFEPDADFIAHAREDVPHLLNALDAVLAQASALDGTAAEVVGEDLKSGLRLAARSIRAAIAEALR